MMSLKLMVPALVTLAALSLSLQADAETTAWVLDASHSRVGFTVPHMVVSSVSGRFKQASGTIALDEANLTKSDVEISIKTDSIDTDEPKRDEHLRGPDFFDAAKYPLIVFKSTKIAPAGGNKYKLTGELTMHGVSKLVTLDANISPAIKNPWGKMVRAVKIAGKVKRSDYGLKWNKTLDAGGVVVGDEVTLDIQVEINR
ncbi:MAG TPA: YceI family protein [Polyangiaceae bacterium]